MLQGITRASVQMVERYLPDAFVLVLILTLVVFGGGMLIEGHGPVAMAAFWGEGFWNLLSFAMQMVLILVSGFVVASTPIFKKLLQALARMAIAAHRRHRLGRGHVEPRGQVRLFLEAEEVAQRLRCGGDGVGPAHGLRRPRRSAARAPP